MSSESASVSPVASFEKCSVVLLDVQGTTTSINFFKETFFPYITKNAEEFLKTNWEDKDVKAAVKDLSEKELDLEAATKSVVELTESSSDNKALKVLQGLITKKGYADKDLKAHVFDDVQEALESWAKSRKVAIYSTGDVNCQKQFFSNTVKGDLSAHISNNFDQAVGAKTEADSYKKIAEQLEVKPDEVVFVTDIEDEGKAAKTAGLSVVLVKREGNAELSEEAQKNYPVVSSFSEISFEEKACKRKNTEEAEEPPTKVAKTDKDEKPEASQAKSEEKVEAEEPMEVDSSAKKTEEPKSEEKPSEKKEETKSEAEPKTEVTTASEAEAKSEVKSQSDKKKESEAEQKKEAEPKKSEEKMDAVDSTEKTEDKKETAAKSPVEETKKDEKKPEEKSAHNEVDSTSKPAENGTVEKKEETKETKEAKEETDSKAEEKASSTTEENGEKATEEKKDEKKPEEKVENGLENSDKKEEAKTNGDATVAQNGEAEKTEKNGDADQNGKSEKNGETEQNGESKKEAETEIKVKKVVPEPESSTEVSVEV